MMHDRRDRRSMRINGTVRDGGHYRRGSYVDSRNDYRRDYRDYGMDRNNDYRDYRDYGNYDTRDYREYYGNDYAGDEWEQDLHKWIRKLQRHDRFNSDKEQVLSQAKNMGVEFKDYTEEEFYATYLMMVSDFPSIANEPRVYMSMAKSWLEDSDVAVEPSEKLCIYYYQIVEGEE